MTTVASQEITVPVVSPETIPAPDLSDVLSKTAVIKFGPMLDLRVTDDTSSRAADANYELASDFIAAVESAVNPIIAQWHKGHKYYTGIRSQLVSLPQQVIDHCRKERTAYRQRIEQERAALERRERDAAEVRARQEADAERALQLENAMPWEVEQILSSPVEVNVPEIYIPPAPTDDGFKTKRKAPTYKITDKATFLKSLAARIDHEPDLMNLVEVVPSRANELIRKHGQSVCKYLPGIAWEQGTTGGWK